MKKAIALLLLVSAAIAAAAQSGVQVFTASGTFTVPENVSAITIEVVGAGGTGGINGGGGGGGGGYASGEYTVSPLSVLNITVGIGGNGSAEGTTSVDQLIAASGGENGFSVSNPNLGGGGAGGMGSGGNISNRSGGAGGGGYWTYFGGGGGGAAGAVANGSNGGNTIVWNGSNCLTPGGAGGINGGAPGGNGGKGAGFIDAFCNVSNPSVAGASYGGGGGGGNGNSGPPAIGSNGYCKISWCNLDLTVIVGDASLATNSTFASYQWLDCDNGFQPIAGATDQYYTPDPNGSYAVIVSNEFCSDTSACVSLLNTGTAGLHDDGLIIYPTQFSANIHVLHAKGGEQYELVNETGQTIWAGRHVEAQDFSLLKNGWYFLKAKDDLFVKTFKLLKQ